MNQLTEAQCATLKGVLISWLDAQADLLHNPHSCSMNRKDVIVHAVTMIKVAVILEDVLGFENAKRDYAPTHALTKNVISSLDSLDFSSPDDSSLDFTAATTLN